jgi:hypothetical protein
MFEIYENGTYTEDWSDYYNFIYYGKGDDEGEIFRGTYHFTGDGDDYDNSAELKVIFDWGGYIVVWCDFSEDNYEMSWFVKMGTEIGTTDTQSLHITDSLIFRRASSL